MASDDTSPNWLIDEPNGGASKDEMQQWLWDNDIAIEAAKTEGERIALEAAKDRVRGHLRRRFGSGLVDRMDADRL